MRSLIKASKLTQITGFVVQVIRTLCIPDFKAQQFIDSSSKVKAFKEGVAKLLNELLDLNPFAAEWIRQTLYYPKGWRAKSVNEQVAKLAKEFPGINLSRVDYLVRYIGCDHRFDDGIAVIPKISFLGKFFGVENPYEDGYEGYDHLVDLFLEKSPSLKSLRVRFDPKSSSPEDNREYYRIDRDVRDILTQLEDSNSGDVLVLPFNFGNLYAGWSARAAKWDILKGGNLPLVSIQMLCLLITMPERLETSRSLFVGCYGDELFDPLFGKRYALHCYCSAKGYIQFSALNGDDTPHPILGLVVAFSSRRKGPTVA